MWSTIGWTLFWTALAATVILICCVVVDASSVGDVTSGRERED